MSASNGNGTRPERFEAVDALGLEWADERPVGAGSAGTTRRRT